MNSHQIIQQKCIQLQLAINTGNTQAMSALMDVTTINRKFTMSSNQTPLLLAATAKHFALEMVNLIMAHPDFNPVFNDQMQKALQSVLRAYTWCTDGVTLKNVYLSIILKLVSHEIFHSPVPKILIPNLVEIIERDKYKPNEPIIKLVNLIYAYQQRMKNPVRSSGYLQALYSEIRYKYQIVQLFQSFPLAEASRLQWIFSLTLAMINLIKNGYPLNLMQDAQIFALKNIIACFDDKIKLQNVIVVQPQEAYLAALELGKSGLGHAKIASNPQRIHYFSKALKIAKDNNLTMSVGTKNFLEAHAAFNPNEHLDSVREIEKAIVAKHRITEQLDFLSSLQDILYLPGDEAHHYLSNFETTDNILAFQIVANFIIQISQRGSDNEAAVKLLTEHEEEVIGLMSLYGLASDINIPESIAKFEKIVDKYLVINKPRAFNAAILCAIAQSKLITELDKIYKTSAGESMDDEIQRNLNKTRATIDNLKSAQISIFEKALPVIENVKDNPVFYQEILQMLTYQASTETRLYPKLKSLEMILKYFKKMLDKKIDVKDEQNIISLSNDLIKVLDCLGYFDQRYYYVYILEALADVIRNTYEPGNQFVRNLVLKIMDDIVARNESLANEDSLTVATHKMLADILILQKKPLDYFYVDRIEQVLANIERYQNPVDGKPAITFTNHTHLYLAISTAKLAGLERLSYIEKAFDRGDEDAFSSLLKLDIRDITDGNILLNFLDKVLKQAIVLENADQIKKIYLYTRKNQKLLDSKVVNKNIFQEYISLLNLAHGSLKGDLKYYVANFNYLPALIKLFDGCIQDGESQLSIYLAARIVLETIVNSHILIKKYGFTQDSLQSLKDKALSYILKIVNKDDNFILYNYTKWFFDLIKNKQNEIVDPTVVKSEVNVEVCINNNLLAYESSDLSVQIRKVMKEAFASKNLKIRKEVMLDFDAPDSTDEVESDGEELKSLVDNLVHIDHDPNPNSLVPSREMREIEHFDELPAKIVMNKVEPELFFKNVGSSLFFTPSKNPTVAYQILDSRNYSNLRNDF
jgi:hypothetical protein